MERGMVALSKRNKEVIASSNALKKELGLKVTLRCSTGMLRERDRSEIDTPT